MYHEKFVKKRAKLSDGEKRLTKQIYPNKEDERQGDRDVQDLSHHEDGQILHLKRLLVTVKQHYEKSVHHIHLELQTERNQRVAAQKECERIQLEWKEKQEGYEDELQALRGQQITLKNLLNRARDELNQLRPLSNRIEIENEQERGQSIDCSDGNFPLREGMEKVSVELAQVRADLILAQNEVNNLKEERGQKETSTQQEINHLQQLLSNQKLNEKDLEESASNISSHYVRDQLEIITQMLIEDKSETKALESRYIALLNEKMELEHECRQLREKMEEQSSKYLALQDRLHHFEQSQKESEASFQAKNIEWLESCKETKELHTRLDDLKRVGEEKELIQHQYHQLKDELKQRSQSLEESIQVRIQLEQQLDRLEAIAANQETKLQEFSEQIHMLHQEKIVMESERDEMRILLDENEENLKIAQQHLAKKVKEAAVLSETVERQQENLNEFFYIIEDQKEQIAQFQLNIDSFQKQEKKLQEQLHDALKGHEHQIVKWEEKYFAMCDKWQESEKQVHELKKFQEKHLQVQSLLTNLGHFIGGGAHPSQSDYQGEQEGDHTTFTPDSFENSSANDPSFTTSETPLLEEKYNLFGMRHPPIND